MRQHRKILSIVGRPAVIAALCLLGMATGRARAQDGSNIARLSFVQGSVQLLAGQDNDFQAVVNMPVLAGSRLQTGGDGQAEVEFGDGSVARLTPNSALEFDRLGGDFVQLQQLAGLSYYEFNVGDGHPPFGLQFANVNVQPTSNAIVRVGLDEGWEAAVVSGSINLQGNGIPPADVTDNQSVRSSGDNNGSPYTVAEGINSDSWDNWNQDRDQAIALEAQEQTPVRDSSGNPQNENWNDLDADGNWYPVQGSGNVWVPAGVGSDWDPYGSGYWAYYPSFGYTWVSGYSWGWLPYHCGSWNYYQFGWGWAPGGGCGRTWSPVVTVRNHPPGWDMPRRPIPGPGVHPRPVERLVGVDRGPAAKGPWSLQGSIPRPNHQLALNFKGTTVAPIVRLEARPQAFAGAKGTSPGTRAVLGGSSPRPISTSTYLWGGNPQRSVERPNPPAVQRPIEPPNVQRPVGRAVEQPNVPRAVEQPNIPRAVERPNIPAPPSSNQRLTYVPRAPAPAPHYAAPPAAPRYSAPPAPPQQRYSAPAAPPQQRYSPPSAPQQRSSPPPSAPHMSAPAPHR